MLRLQFKEMTWFFLSAFADVLREKKAGPTNVQDICGKGTRFDDLYVNDAKKSEGLYARFIQTKAYRNFLRSASLSKLFN